MIELTLLIPVIFAIAIVPFRRSLRAVEGLAILGASLSLANLLASALSANFFQHPVSGLFGFLYVDPLGFLFTLIIATITLFVIVYSRGYLREELREGIIKREQLWRYYSLLLLFLSCMVLVTFASDFLLIWAGLEATTLTSVFLISFYNTKESVEAAWKYFIICSLGITLALVGLMILGYGMQQAGLAVSFGFINVLANAHLILPIYLKLAFAFIFVGYGTKMGLVPLHEWLPDAHSQAPTPISALLSGVLLSTAFYAILRTYPILSQSPGTLSFGSTLFLVFGAMSLILASLRLFSQTNYKRLLAYSSVENMGIIALGVGIGGPLGLFAALFYNLSHSLVKPLAFFLGGVASLAYRTKQISRIRGLSSVMPALGKLFVLTNIGVAGSIPFGTFISEIALLAAALATGHYLVVLLLAVFTTITFGTLLLRSSQMSFGPVTQKPGKYLPDGITRACIWGLFFLAIILGLLIPTVLAGFVNSAVAVLIKV
ncbi:MAG TPA: proton-conducting transporter membrane subunit [Candidatus Baltobacteraceae bacterium]|nr:proton-conducting transporter membrane subunit [Candidatus Baltobacteraceae bacterium]